MNCAKTLQKYHAALSACKTANDKVIEVTRNYEAKPELGVREKKKEKVHT